MYLKEELSVYVITLVLSLPITKRECHGIFGEKMCVCKVAEIMNINTFAAESSPSNIF